MRYRIISAHLSVILLTGLFPFLSSCAIMTGSERAGKATAKMEIVDTDIKKSVAQIDATGASLEALTSPELPKTQEAFETFSDNVSEMESLGKALIKHTDEMSARGKDYFDEWKKQGNTYTNPQIQQISEARMAELNAVFRKISGSSVGVKSAFMAYLSDIREIQRYLSNDLTDKGIASITPVARKAITEGDNLKNSLIPVISSLNRARREMSQGGAD